MTSRLPVWWFMVNGEAHSFVGGSMVALCPGGPTMQVIDDVAGPADEHCQACLVGTRQIVSLVADDLTEREFRASTKWLDKAAESAA